MYFMYVVICSFIGCLIFSRRDSFKVMCGTYLGRLTKIRIGHDNSGLGPGWFLNKASYFDSECWIWFDFVFIYM